MQPDPEFLIFLLYINGNRGGNTWDLSLTTWFFDVKNWTVDRHASSFWLKAEAFARPTGQVSGSVCLSLFSLQRELMLKGTLHVSQSLNCKCKTAEDRGMPY